MPNVDTTANKSLNEQLGGGYSLMFNVRNAPLNNVNFRQAIAYATDRQTMLQDALYGWGQIAYGPVAPVYTWAYTDNVPTYDFNVANATAAMAKSGVAPGSTTLRVTYDSGKAELVAMAQMLQQFLRDIGITITLTPLPRSTLVSTIAAWDFDIVILGTVTGPDPSGLGNFFATDAIKHVYFTNTGGYSNPKVDALLQSAVSTSVKADRGKLYQQLQGIIQDDLPYYWLFYRVPGTVWNTAFQTLRSPYFVPSPMADCDTFEHTFWTKGTAQAST